MRTTRIRRATLVTTVVAAVAALVAASGSSAQTPHPTCFGELPTIRGTDGNDMITGTARDDVVLAFGGDDVVIGGGGSDLICGGDGNDTLLATGGDPYDYDISGISGDAGDDRIQGSSGAIVVAAYDEAPGPVTVDLGAGTATGWGNDTLVHVQVVFGSSFDDSLTGSNERNALLGFAGNDTIAGAGDEDWLIGDAGNDTIDGGRGRDVVDYEEAPNGVRVNLATGTASGWGADALRSIELVRGSPESDVLIGGRAADQLAGLGGNDRLVGGAGSDRLDGGKGVDRADGGPARDVCSAEKRVRCP